MLPPLTDSQKAIQTPNGIYSRLLSIYPSDTWIDQTTHQEGETKS